MPNQTLADLMTRHVQGVAPTCTVGEAFALMARVRASSLLVLNERLPVGIVTERDVVHALRKRTATDAPVTAVMSAPVLTAPAGLDVLAAYHLAHRHGVRHLVVVDPQGQCVGVVSESDFRTHLGLDFYHRLRDVRALMDAHAPWLPPDAGLDEALATMEEARTSFIVVADRDRIPLGIITERDVVRLYGYYPQGDYPRLDQVMTQPVETIPAGAAVTDAAARMAEARIRHLVVVDGHGAMIGSLTQHDLLRPLSLGLIDQALSERRTLQAQNEQAHERLRLVMDAVEDGLWDWDVVLDQVYWNPRSCRMLGYPDDTHPITLGAWRELIHPDDLTAVLAAVDDSLRPDGAGFSVELRCRHHDGHWPWLQARGKVVERAGDGRPLRMIGTLTDISRRKAMEERLRESEQRFHSLFANMSEGVALHELILDAAGQPVDYHLVEVNPQYERMLGRPRDQVVGRPASEVYGSAATTYLKEFTEVVRSGRPTRLEIYLETLNRCFDVSVVPWEQRGFATIFTDVTDQRRAAEHLQRLAHYDALTRLPNRVLLADRLQQAMANTRRGDRLLAVCYLDLDGFKPINDAYGHEVGDRLLIDVAHRLKACLRASDTLARLGGDEFAILLSDMRDLDECDRALDRILDAVSAAGDVDGHTLRVSASIGVTLYPQDAAEPEVLLRHADQAMYMAKQAGRDRYHLFDPEHDRRTRAHREALARFEAALHAGELRLYYQPKVHMRTGRVIGAEALIRWQHPERGLLLPSAFLPVVQESDLAVDLDQWVLAEAVRQLDAWRRDGLHLTVSINISGRHLQQHDFAERLAVILSRHPRVPPESIKLEVLETAAFEDIGRISALIHECRRLGVGFSLDDFGTGYSSLTYLKRLPVGELKIDQSFIRDILDDPENLAIVEGVLGLAEAFQRQVVAEGVETEEHGLLLLQLGCELAQGYGIARPMPPEELPGWIATYAPPAFWTSVDETRWSRQDLPLINASADLRRWMGQVDALLTGTDQGATLLDPHKCRFGRWYYGGGRERYAHLSEYRELEPIHRRMHALVRELVATHSSGAQAPQQVEELRVLREELVRRLRALQVAVLQGGR